MSAPDPSSVKMPPPDVELPATPTAPTSASVQADRTGVGVGESVRVGVLVGVRVGVRVGVGVGVVEVEVTATPSKVATPAIVLSRLVTASLPERRRPSARCTSRAISRRSRPSNGIP